MDLGLRGRTYVVTGGSRGLGLATATALAEDGARTVIVARDHPALADARAQLGPGHESLAADLSDPLTAERIAEQVGALDGALINIGGPPPGAMLELDDADWHAAFEAVFLSSVRLIRAFAPRVRDGGALLVVLSSTVKEPIAGLAASNGLRPGLAMAVKDLSVSLAPRVRINGIVPGRIATARLREVFPDDDGAGIPLGRAGDPAEFGRVAAFLLSPAASYITGTLVAVDGGLLRSPW